jgi:PucR C-terminal helix-turn-helix domain
LKTGYLRDVNPPSSRVRALLPDVRARVPVLLADVSTTLDACWPDYAAFLRCNDVEVAQAAEMALQRLLNGQDRLGGVEQHLFEEIGRIQCECGRDLADLLSAYQTGAGVCWRHLSEIAVAAELPPRDLASLAAAVFSFVDILTSCSARGYVREQAAAAGARERWRDELVTLLLSPGADPAAIRAAAARAAWTVPDEASVVLLEPENPLGERMLARLDIGHLPIRRPGLFGAILPRPSRPGLHTRLVQALRGTGTVVGRATALSRLAASLPIAQTAMELRRSGVLPDDPLFVDEHLDAIIVHRDDILLAALQDQVLRPFARCRSGSRERLAETLLAWLRHMGDRRAMATELHVHPQTVSYRVARLHELFGDDLEKPDVRARLLLALAWDQPTHRRNVGRAGLSSAPTAYRGAPCRVSDIAVG